MSYKLTPLGELRAKRVEQVRDSEGAILEYLYRVGEPVTDAEIMDETRMNDEKAIQVMAGLIHKELVKEV